MYKKRLKVINLSLPNHIDETKVTTPCVNLGTRLRDQMYSGVDSSASTLLTGQFDDDDNWEVDPACDMSTDRFTLDVQERVPVVTPTPSPEE